MELTVVRTTDDWTRDQWGYMLQAQDHGLEYAVAIKDRDVVGFAGAVATIDEAIRLVLDCRDEWKHLSYAIINTWNAMYADAAWRLNDCQGYRSFRPYWRDLPPTKHTTTLLD